MIKHQYLLKLLAFSVFMIFNSSSVSPTRSRIDAHLPPLAYTNHTLPICLEPSVSADDSYHSLVSLILMIFELLFEFHLWALLYFRIIYSEISFKTAFCLLFPIHLSSIFLFFSFFNLPHIPVSFVQQLSLNPTASNDTLFSENARST